jgi:uncharacterized protein (DUF433 family)
MSTVAYPHIEVEPDGEAYIAGTRFKVRMLIEEHLAAHVEADELARRHPHLTLAQIYGALVYYHDHKREVDRQIDELAHVENRLRHHLENPATTERLRKAMQQRKGRQ